MGKWKYVNWLIVLIILAHMYYYFSRRYEAHALVYALATAGWLALAILGYYVYVYRINRSGQIGKTSSEIPLTKPTVRERPKVSFKKKEGDR